MPKEDSKAVFPGVGWYQSTIAAEGNLCDRLINFLVAIYVTQQIWFKRNARVFESNFKPPSQCVTQALEAIGLYHQASIQPKNQATPNPPE
jgi:hypothetical protein